MAKWRICNARRKVQEKKRRKAPILIVDFLLVVLDVLHNGCYFSPLGQYSTTKPVWLGSFYYL